MKELNQKKINALAQLNEPSGKLRSRLCILWIDGDPARARLWAAQHNIPIGVMASRSPDLKAWNVDPTIGDTTVIVVENRTAGTASGLVAASADDLLTRTASIAGKRAHDKNPAIKKWASLVIRKTSPRTLPPARPVSPARPELADISPLSPTPLVRATLLPTSASPVPPGGGEQLLVVGNNSDNIVRFDLATGKATVIAKLATGSRPWSIAVSPVGDVFVGLHGNKKNVVRLTPGSSGTPDGPLVAVDVTNTIGRFGPGLMAFDQHGLLVVAGDTNRAVLRYDVKTGKLVETMRLRAANLVGLTLHGNSVYAAEYFQKTILRFDLSADPPSGEKFIYKSDRLNRAHGMTIGHNGNLFVSNLKNSLVQEFDIETGEFIKTFLNVHSIGGSAVKDLHFDPGHGQYFLTSGDAVYVVSSDGALLARHQSAALSGAVAVAIPVARPASSVAEAAAPNAGLIGYATRAGVHVPVALRYQHGKVLQPERLVGSVTVARQTPRNVKLTFHGHLHVPKRMAIKAFVAGGSSNGGQLWLKVANWELGPLGDDHKKQASTDLLLDAGDYPIEWTLVGGDFGCGLLKFIDAETSQLLSVQHARSDVRDVTIERQIQTSSDKPGWPVKTEWIDQTTKSWNLPGDILGS